MCLFWECICGRCYCRLFYLPLFSRPLQFWDRIQIKHQPDATWSGRPARPRTQHDCHHDTKIKPEAATTVIELLMMGGKTPETCWAVNKRQKINWKIVASGWCFIWIVRWCTDLQTLNFEIESVWSRTTPNLFCKYEFSQNLPPLDFVFFFGKFDTRLHVYEVCTRIGL
jgi:hypothetical protein